MLFRCLKILLTPLKCISLGLDLEHAHIQILNIILSLDAVRYNNNAFVYLYRMWSTILICVITCMLCGLHFFTCSKFKKFSSIFGTMNVNMILSLFNLQTKKKT